MNRPTESEMLAEISRIFSALPHDPRVLVGIGDDAAVVTSPSADKKNLYASDMAVEGSHFRRDWSSLFEIGAKVAAANIADIYAMGGLPRYGLISVGVPADFTLDNIRELAQGISSEFAQVSSSPIGGDLTRSQALTISIAMIGECTTPILRSGAQPGDTVVISGITGQSALGLELLKLGMIDSRSDFHRSPILEYGKAESLVGATALIDTSDSLVSESTHIASASAVRIALAKSKLALIPGYAELEREAVAAGLDIWALILHGGEDHRFLATLPGEPPAGFYEIGRVEAGTGVTVDGVEISHRGFDQFK